jgi:DNA-binding transcriptional MerR regulator
MTVREYHNTGIIPQPTHFDTRGWRLYTPEQVALARDLFAKYDAKKLTRQQLIEQLQRGWKIGEEISY